MLNYLSNIEAIQTPHLLKMIKKDEIFPTSQEPKKWPFILMAVFLFPIILLVVASMQPKIFFDKNSNFYLFSANIFYIHLSIFILLTVGVIHYFGKVKFNELGLSFEKLKYVLWLVPVIWIVEQLILFIVSWFGLSTFSLNEIWLTNNSSTKALSSFVANTIATGLNEEVFFRGFLFTQFFIILNRRLKGSNKRNYAFIFAALLSSLIFAMCHLQASLDAILFLTFGGLVGSTIYYLTNNIFYGIILHGFFNSPLPLLKCDEMTAKLVVLSIIIGIIILISVRKFKNKRTDSLALVI